MSNKLLIDNSQPEEKRIAFIGDDGTLYDAEIQLLSKQPTRGNIYIATVDHIENSLHAAFVRYGDKHGFLPLKECAPMFDQGITAMATPVEETEDENRATEEGLLPPTVPKPNTSSESPILLPGQKILIQIDKEERGSKRAAVTSYIRLAGYYLILMPNNPNAGGISRRIEGEERAEMRQILDNLSIPEGMSVIVRTAGLGRSRDELAFELEFLCNLWRSILNTFESTEETALVYQESNMIYRVLRDHMRQEISEIWVNDRKLYEDLQRHMVLVHPDHECQLQLYDKPHNLFAHFNIENQLETAYVREVQLPSGGSIVIDRTEALTAIDVNSAKSTKGGGIEETAFTTNLEAAKEIARQCRLRDIGGLIIIDFIDMYHNHYRKDVEAALREAVQSDRARIQILPLSRLGLLEMSRQRLRHSFEESFYETCPKCLGARHIRTVPSAAVQILRTLEESALRLRNCNQLVVHCPTDVCTYLVNEKRKALSAIEAERNITILIVPNPSMEQGYRIDRNKIESEQIAYSHEKITKALPYVPAHESQDAIETPLLDNVEMPRRNQRTDNLIKRIFRNFFKAEDIETKPEQKAESSPEKTENTEEKRTAQTRGQNNRSQKTGRHSNNRRRKPANAQRRNAVSETSRPVENKQSTVQKRNESSTKANSFSTEDTRKPVEKGPIAEQSPIKQASSAEDNHTSTTHTEQQPISETQQATASDTQAAAKPAQHKTRGRSRGLYGRGNYRGKNNNASRTRATQTETPPSEG